MDKINIQSSPDKYFFQLQKVAEEIKKKFLDWGILTSLVTDAESSNDNRSTVNSSKGWLQFFIVRNSAEAFYKSIGNLADVRLKVEEFELDLDSLHEKLARFAEQNETLNEEMRKKVTRLNAGVSRAKKAMVVRGKSLMRECAENCSTVEELQKVVTKMFAKLIEEKLLDGIMLPLYEGMSVGFNNVYAFILQKLNEFLMKWGVITVEINVGDKMNDALYVIYQPTSDSQNNHTKDKKLQETVKEILHFAYIFNSRTEQPYIIWNGAVSIWRYDG